MKRIVRQPTAVLSNATSRGCILGSERKDTKPNSNEHVLPAFTASKLLASGDSRGARGFIPPSLNRHRIRVDYRRLFTASFLVHSRDSGTIETFIGEKPPINISTGPAVARTTAGK